MKQKLKPETWVGIFLIAVTFLLAAAGLVRGSFTLYAKDREQLP
jgi:hypothetical protein